LLAAGDVEVERQQPGQVVISDDNAEAAGTAASRAVWESFSRFFPGRHARAVYALPVARAVFLILELDHPFFGVVQISGEPPRSALEQLGR
jgi:hypothetical protein